MNVIKHDFLDTPRNRKIPVLVYLHEKSDETLPVMLWNAGYGGGQENFKKTENGERKWPYEQGEYLAKFFTEKAMFLFQFNMISLETQMVLKH